MKNTVVTIQQMKEKGEKISMLTAYDYSTAIASAINFFAAFSVLP